MSYNISISGHKNTASDEESIAFEEEVAAKAKEFVESLEGVSNASMSAGHASYNLMPVTPDK